jgi:RNA polymerase sigma-70 factor (ECF subfamily)
LGDGDPKWESSFPPFDSFREQFGFVPKIFRTQFLLPRLVEAEHQLISTILFADKALSRAQKECILLVLSAANADSYWFGLHYQTLKLLGLAEERLDGILVDFEQADLSPINKALVRFSLNLTSVGSSISPEDFREASSHGLTDAALLEAVLTVALGRFLCVLSSGVGATADFVLRPIPPARFLSFNGQPSARNEKSGFFLPAPPTEPGDVTTFDFLNEQFGFIPSVFGAQTLRPDVLRAEAFALRSILVPQDALTRVQKERILLSCDSQVQRPASDRALLDFVGGLSSQPGKSILNEVRTLKEQGLGSEQILEAVVTASLACFLNVLEVGLGAEPHFAAPCSRRTATITPTAKNTHLSDADPRHTDIAVSEDPDSSCLDRIRSGELDSFEDLMNRYGQRVYRTLLGILRNPEEARDAVQDTFLKAFQHLPGFEGRSKFSTWLLSIAINTGLQRLRERRPMESLDESRPDDERFRPRQLQAWVDDPEKSYSRAEVGALIDRAVMGLPAKYRVVIVLRDIEQLSGEETASALGLAIPAMKSRLLRGRLMLREALAPHFSVAVSKETGK